MNEIKIELKWAIYFTLVGLVWMVFERQMGWHGENIAVHPKYTNLFAIPAIVMMVLALRDKKKNFFNGQMTYVQGLVSGIKLSVMIGILSLPSQYITHTFISPDYFANAIAYSVEFGGVTQEQADSYFTLNSYLIQGALGGLIMGIITSAIVCIFLRSKKA